MFVHICVCVCVRVCVEVNARVLCTRVLCMLLLTAPRLHAPWLCRFPACFASPRQILVREAIYFFLQVPFSNFRVGPFFEKFNIEMVRGATARRP